MAPSAGKKDFDPGQLCLACGLCCNGVIFADVQLQPGDDPRRLRALGLRIPTPRSELRHPNFNQPCAALEGCRCRIYAERPKYCREFECVLFKNFKAGRLEMAAALRIIGVAKHRAEKVRRLLAELDEKDEQTALGARFRRTARRMDQLNLDEATAERYAQLALAVHDLNCLLSDAFYPGAIGE